MIKAFAAHLSVVLSIIMIGYVVDTLISIKIPSTVTLIIALYALSCSTYLQPKIQRLYKQANLNKNIESDE